MTPVFCGGHSDQSSNYTSINKLIDIHDRALRGFSLSTPFTPHHPLSVRMSRR